VQLRTAVSVAWPIVRKDSGETRNVGDWQPGFHGIAETGFKNYGRRSVASAEKLDLSGADLRNLGLRGGLGNERGSDRDQRKCERLKKHARAQNESPVQLECAWLRPTQPSAARLGSLG
jgi:hypothetical protein